MDELHHNLEVRPYNNTTVSNFWGALQERQEVFFVRGFIAFEKTAWYHQSID